MAENNAIANKYKSFRFMDSGDANLCWWFADAFEDVAVQLSFLRLYFVNEELESAFVDLHQIQKIENPTKVTLPVVVLHDAFVQLEALLLLLVLVDKHRPPIMLIRVLEKARFLLLFLSLLLHLLDHLALHQPFLVLGLFLGFVAATQQAFDDVRHERAKNHSCQAD